MFNKILVALFVTGVLKIILPACSLELKDSDLALDAYPDAILEDNKVLETNRTCIRSDECQVIELGCCGEGTEFMALNKAVAFEVKSKIRFDCNIELRKNKALCKDKKKLFGVKVPGVECKENTCELKTESSDSASTQSTDQGACKTENECEVVDKDCCKTGKERVAINRRFGSTVRQEILKTCRAKLQENKKLCRATRQTVLGDRARCVDNVCKIQ